MSPVERQLAVGETVQVGDVLVYNKGQSRISVRSCKYDPGCCVGHAVTESEDYRRPLLSIIEDDLLRRMAHEIRTQDNRMTSEPMFCVLDNNFAWDPDTDERLDVEQTFFTNSGARGYLQFRDGTVDEEQYIYVASGNHNPEWRAVRALLLALFPEEEKT